MKKIAIIALSLAALQAAAQEKYTYTEASSLTLTGKIISTGNPYHRVDTCRYKEFTPTENFQVRCPSGLAVLFKTNSSTVTVKPDYGEIRRSTVTPDLAQVGFDLYIRKDRKWMFAGSGVGGRGKEEREITLVRDMDGSEKECMLYLPMYSELHSLKIGTDKGAIIKPMDTPFRHRIAIFGSSYTQGAGISRPGMAYPMQFTRNTGIQLLSLGCGGNGKMQPQFAAVLEDAQVDAMIFDCFSNPDAKMIEERTIPFIERMKEAHPDMPLIFISTVYRENRNFSLRNEKYEQAKMDMAEKVMRQAVKQFDDVYFVNIPDLTGDDHETSVDGVHPTDMGYARWARALEKPVLKILRKYGLE